jgi:hypothetical protein
MGKIGEMSGLIFYRIAFRKQIYFNIVDLPFDRLRVKKLHS